MSEAPKPVSPRPSATILLLRDEPLEVLMIRRHAEQVFASALVFPGGTLDPGDGSDEWLPYLVGAELFSAEDRALRIAAFRETFEESGILLARDESGAPVACVDEDRSDFLDIVRRKGGQLWLEDLVLFGHWITPEPAPKRFDTRFFLAVAPRAQKARCDGREAVALEWVRPQDMLARAGTEGRELILPTRMNLLLLSRSDDSAGALADARERPVFTVLARMERRPDGIMLTIPAEAGYGETQSFVPSKPV